MFALKDIQQENPPIGTFLEDISRQHRNAIIKFGGKKFRCTGSAVYSQEKVFLGVSVVKGEKDTERFVPMDLVDNSFPEVGYYNIRKKGVCNKTLLLERLTNSRQWRYGFHPTICRTSVPYWSDGGLVDRLLEDSIKSLETTSSSSVITSRYLNTEDEVTPYIEALKLIRGGKSIAEAISRQIAVAACPFREEIGVFILGKQVGTVNKDNTINYTQLWAIDFLKEVIDNG